MGGLIRRPARPGPALRSEGRSGPALVVNAGSTSLKAAVFADGSDDAVWAVNVDAASIGADRTAGFEKVLASAPARGETAVVGHRVVHGGTRFDRPVVIDAEVEAAIVDLEELAPIHNRAALDGIAAARRVVDPTVPHVAVFDTAFHHGMPDAAAAYGGPHQWLDKGLRRYGFHGISHQDAASRAATILGRPLEALRMVTCHLGGGCSLAAVAGGASVDTTMGLTPLDGLVMATRSGSVDPGLIFHLLRSGATVNEVENVMEQHSGLLGLSEVSSDLRRVIAARDGGDRRAALAVDVFVHRVATGVGAMIAAMGGADAIVFTGGIGEHSPEVRARVGERLAFCGVVLDLARNQADPVNAELSGAGATVAVLVVAAREELTIARDAWAVLARL
ncbi:MAG: acetate/propionate family kinase [Acidimicrobiales bacterium]